MKDLIEYIAKSLVDSPDGVKVVEESDRGRVIVRLEVAEDDYGKVIGKGGRIAQSMRALLKVAAVRADEYASLALHMIDNPYLNGEVVRLDASLRMAPK